MAQKAVRFVYFVLKIKPQIEQARKNSCDQNVRLFVMGNEADTHL